ncbi:MAG: DUF4214 domain-containing protein, partial [Deltaproteobacteria bacterium]|nr:DUF4214 domain-containing protein [Deltaproteobacteria bacterium]
MAITATELTALYLSYFGRPPDQGGMEFYLAQEDATVQSVADAFSASPESMDLIGPTFGPDQVNRIYLNLFGRDAEPDGLAYWTKQVADGLMTPAFAAYGIFLGAQNADLISVQNKMLVATTFLEHLDTPEELAGYSGNEAAQAAREYMDTVGSSPSSVASALSNLDAAILAMLSAGEGEGPTYTYVGANPIEEGQTVVVVIQTTGIAPGVVLDWSMTGIQPEDMEGALSGTVTVDADGKARLLITPLIDTLGDSPETITLTVGGGVFSITLNESSGPLFDSYLVDATLNGNNNVYKNGASTGLPDFTSKFPSDVLKVGGTTTVGALLNFKDVTLDDKSVLTMAVATHDSLLAATKLNATGTQTVNLSDAFSGTLDVDIENYGLGSVSGNDVTLGLATHNVTGGSGDDIVRMGTFTSISGTLDGGSQGKFDSLYVSTTGADLTVGTITNFEAINLDTNVNAKMTAAQANFLLLGAGTNTVTVKDAGTITGAAAIENYTLADAAGNDFTLGASAQNVTGSATQNDIVRTGGVTSVTGTLTAG